MRQIIGGGISYSDLYEHTDQLNNVIQVSILYMSELLAVSRAICNEKTSFRGQTSIFHDIAKTYSESQRLKVYFHLVLKGVVKNYRGPRGLEDLKKGLLKTNMTHPRTPA